MITHLKVLIKGNKVIGRVQAISWGKRMRIVIRGNKVAPVNNCTKVSQCQKP